MSDGFSNQTIRSISNNTSFGIYPLNDTSDQIFISYTGLDCTSGYRYQAYVQTRAYGEVDGSANLRFMVEGYTGDYDYGRNAVAYMSPSSSNWSAVKPSDNVGVESGLLELTFDFHPEGFPGVTPDYYALSVGTELTDTGHFIVVDEFHVDKYMKQNAFTDVLVPSGYLLEITPDIGWHDTLSMFGERDNLINPHLKAIGPFTLTSGAIDNQDGTVTVVPSEDELESAVSNNFRDYLWRVIPIAYNGAPGPGGLPRKFEYFSKVFDEEFKITNVSNDPLSATKIIQGTKTKRMTVLVDGEEDHPGVEYPTAESWKVTIILNKAHSRVGIQGKDIDGATTATVFVDLENKYTTLKEQALWNVFDEHGLLVDLPRLPKEKNQKYADRISKLASAPGVPTYAGVISASNINLGLDKIDKALSIKLAATDIPNTENLEIDVTASAVLIRTTDLVTTEKIVVDPVLLTATLSEAISDNPTNVELLDGSRISEDEISYFDEDSERPDYNKIIFSDHSVGGRAVRITYPYYRAYYYSDYPTVAALYNAIKEYTNSVGAQALSMN